MKQFEHYHKLIFETKKALYYASSLGYVLKKNKSDMIERVKSSFMKDGRLAVNIAGKTIFLGQLIAKAFMRDYKSNCCVGYKDGNRKNCNITNLYLLTRFEAGKKVGKNNNRGKCVVVKENKKTIKYRTTKEASKALFCSYRTLQDYLKGRYKSSILDIPERKIYYA